MNSVELQSKQPSCLHPDHVPNKNMGCNSKKVIDILNYPWYKYKIKNLGRCWQSYECTECGCFFEIDSSD